MIETVGSVCSGIEAATVAWSPLGFKFEWFSEIEAFPSKLLKEKYPDVINLGDMKQIPDLIAESNIKSPDLICGGTPCQAFSLAGWKNGLEDDRGNLTLKFVDIVEENDKKRKLKGLEPSVVFWENVEGVLSDKTNAFGSLVSSLAGFEEILSPEKWPNSGIIRGPKRNIAWRVLDAKYFGLPQQRKRLYMIAGGIGFFPETILFEEGLPGDIKENNDSKALTFIKDGDEFEIFREYTDCLYAAYGTKWNGNAAAYNGSLFVSQNKRLRRLSPLECERLMGFPDNYTDIEKASRTNRYQALGNSWSVPVVKWIGEKISNYSGIPWEFDYKLLEFQNRIEYIGKSGYFIDFGKDVVNISENTVLNCTLVPKNVLPYSMEKIIDTTPPESLYISSVGCYGIIRRKNEKNININPSLEELLLKISSEMSFEEIEKISLVQKRGKSSRNVSLMDASEKIEQLNLF